MIEVDARGLSCPEPVLRTKDAFKEFPGESYVVIVSDVNARENVKNLAASQGKKVEVEKKDQDFYLTIK